jgi:uroporphyrinogen decarboxylase
MMRQAGRYHRHYQGLRARHGFMSLCKDPALAAEVALGPVVDFDFDVAILFSDLLFPLEALGMGLDYDAGPPRLGFRLDADSLQRLRGPREALPALEFQREAMAATRARLPPDKSLVGFVGGAWTLLGYAVEGSHKGGLLRTRTLAPTLAGAFNDRLLPLLEGNVRLQIEGGAEAVLLLDTAAGDLPLDEWTRWALPAVESLAAAFPWRLGYYMRGASPAHWAALRAAGLPLAGIGFDAALSVSAALEDRRAGFVQGNFDQEAMALPEPAFREALERWLAPLRSITPSARRGWVCGVGHGLTPRAREENVRAFVKTIREQLE